MAAALWDILANAANLAQLSGLNAIMLVAVATGLLYNPQSRQECAKLEQCARKLQALLQWPTSCVMVMQHTEMGNLVHMALHEAAGLVESYKRSTLWWRVRTDRSMAARFRDMQSRINSYWGLVLFINGHLLIQTIRPPSDHDNMINQLDDQSHSAQAQALTRPTGAEATQRANGIGHEGIGCQPVNADPGSEHVSAIMIPILDEIDLVE